MSKVRRVLGIVRPEVARRAGRDLERDEFDVTRVALGADRLGDVPHPHAVPAGHGGPALDAMVAYAQVGSREPLQLVEAKPAWPLDHAVDLEHPTGRWPGIGHTDLVG